MQPSPKPEYQQLEVRDVADAIRIPASKTLELRRVGAKVEHHVGELFPRVGFTVTNLPLPPRAVVRSYDKRGTAEPWIKEGTQAAPWTRLSGHRFPSE